MPHATMDERTAVWVCIVRFLLAPDSFKECATAREICQAMELGVRRVFPQAEIIAVPMADGGEGTVEAMMGIDGGRQVKAEVSGPLGDPVTATYGLLEDSKTALIEMASASGLPLVSPSKRDPGVTSTLGTGQLIAHALDQGVERIVLGLGGSATNDGGSGMATALGYTFHDAEGHALSPGGLALNSLTRIDDSQRDARLDSVEIIAAYDVAIPLLGPNGASFTFSYQKGADESLAQRLEDGLQTLAEVIRAQLGVNVAAVAGAGAAGGLGAGLVAFAGATLRPGVEVVAEVTRLEERMNSCDLVFTGEGSLDGQSIEGKTPVGVSRIAKKLDVPVAAFAGTLGEGYEALYDEGIDFITSISPATVTVEYAIKHYDTLLADAVEKFARSWAEENKLKVD